MSKPTFSRVRSMRKRTWLVSGVLVVSLAFYVLVSVSVGKKINILDFLVLATMQVIVHGVYFPDGALFGEKDATFTTNKNAYNDKAYRVNEEACFGELREYCKIEWERRKHEYVLSELNAIGITEKEFCEIKKLSAAEIKKLKEFETQGKKFFFSRHKRKRLIRLIFSPIPVKPNNPSAIMGATSADNGKPIHDTSKRYNVQQYTKRIIMSFIVGFIFAYIAITQKDGITIMDIAKFVYIFASLVMVAVFAFSSGEKSTKFYKNHFYIDLCGFLDEFFEWKKNMKNIDKISVKELTTAEAYGIIGTENDGSQSVANSDEQKNTAM